MVSRDGNTNDESNLDRRRMGSMFRRDYIFLVVAVVFVLLIFRNMFTKDYHMETKSYLTAIGRKDAIDKVVPKTRTEILQEKIQKDLLLESLDRNVSFLLQEYRSLRYELDILKNNSKSNNRV